MVLLFITIILLVINVQRKEKEVMEARKKKQKSVTNNSLVSNDFFPKGIEINTKKIFPMLVMATMSSGKSTLINALLGQEILPNENKACTAKVYSILDDDQNTKLRIYITDTSGDTVIKEENLAEELDKANNDDSVSEILICGQIKGVLNTDKALMIVDTPGPNNARDLSHEENMLNVLGKINGGLILYVMNATQMGINDDKYLLSILNKYMKDHKKANVVFVINKVDQVDIEYESIEKIVMSTKAYLIDNGFDTPTIIPISALAANILKKVLNENELTRKEYRDFTYYYDLYGTKDFNMKSYAITEEYPDPFKKISVKDKILEVGNLIQAIENTGIKLLEDHIQKLQILSSVRLRNSIRIKK